MTDAPDTSTYYLLHGAMRTSSDRLAGALAGMMEPDRVRAKAVARWVAGFCAELEEHHTVEDTVFFPALAARVPTYADHAATLDEDHEHLHDVLAALRLHTGRMADGMDWAKAQQAAAALAAQLRDLLDEHLDLEDRDVVPLFERHFSAEEYGALDARAREHLSLRQAGFVVPWLLSSVSGDDRRRLLDTAPLPLKAVWVLNRRPYARLAATALGEDFPLDTHPEVAPAS